MNGIAASPAPARSDAGFTLTELMVAIVISGIIVGTLAMSMIAFLHNAYNSTRREDHSAGASLLATYLNRDLASATSRITPASNACASVPGASYVLTLKWTDWTATPGDPSPAPNGTVYTATYGTVVDTTVTTGTRYRLDRWYCAGSSLVSRNPVVGNLASGDVAFPTPSPTPAPCPTPAILLVIQLNQFETDAASNDYRYTGCLGARVPVRRDLRRDEGVTLIFVLIFITILAVFIAAAITKTGTTTLTGERVRDRGRLQYALDGGASRALQVLKVDLASGLPQSAKTWRQGT